MNDTVHSIEISIVKLNHAIIAFSNVQGIIKCLLCCHLVTTLFYHPFVIPATWQRIMWWCPPRQQGHLKHAQHKDMLSRQHFVVYTLVQSYTYYLNKQLYKTL